ncbi:hypothetical protein M0804_001729 [Polistes exclamans]|nr:hypothetical protein M0804_001729 [Polistes exclamans]
MDNAGHRNAEYIRVPWHSYLNQHNSSDEWLTGFGSGIGKAWSLGSGIEEEGRPKRNALHLWNLLPANFSVKCVIYGYPYYLRSRPASTIQSIEAVGRRRSRKLLGNYPGPTTEGTNKNFNAMLLLCSC